MILEMITTASSGPLLRKEHLPRQEGMLLEDESILITEDFCLLSQSLHC